MPLNIKYWSLLFILFSVLCAHGQNLLLENTGKITLLEDLYQQKLYDSCLVMTASYIKKVDTDKSGIDTPTLIRTLIYHGDYLQQRVQYKEAIPHFKRAMMLNKWAEVQSFNADLLSLNMLIHTHTRINDFDAVKGYMDQADELMLNGIDTLNKESADNFYLKGMYFMLKQDLPEAKHQLQRALQTYRKINDTLHFNYARSLATLGWVFKLHGQFNVAERYMHNAMTTVVGIKGEGSSALSSYYANLSAIYIDMQNFDQALTYAKRGLELTNKSKHLDSAALASQLNGIGVIYQYKSEYHEAIQYFKDAISIGTASRGDEHADLVNYFANISSAFLQIKNYEQASYFLKKAKINLGSNFGEDHPYMISILEQSANLLQNQGDLSTAEMMIEDAKNRFRKKYKDPDESPLVWSSILFTQSKLYGRLGKQDLAIAGFEEYLKWMANISHGPHETVALAFEELAEIYNNDNDHDQAIAYNNKSLEKLGFNFSDNNFVGIVSPANLVDALGFRSIVRRTQYKINRDAMYLTQAVETDKKNMLLLKYLFATNQREETNALLRSEFYWLFESMLQNSYLRYQHDGDRSHLDFALEVMELNKHYALLQNFNDRQQVQYADVDSKTLEEEAQLLNATRQFSLQRSNYIENGEQDSLKLFQVIDSLKFYTHQFDKFKEQLQLTHRSYFNEKYRSQFTTITDLQSLLEKTNSCMIEYFVGDSSIYSIVLDEEKVDFHYKKINSQFFKKTNDVLLTMKNPTRMELGRDENIDMLSNILITEPSESHSKYNRVIIIPDGVLGYIPFELLKANAFSSESNPTGYWGLHTNISYAYSASLYQQQVEQYHNRTATFNGFVVDYSNQNSVDNHEQPQLIAMVTRSGELTLPDAYNEVLEIKNMVGGNIFTGTEATKDNFIKNSADAPLIHLAMHTVLHDSLPLESGFIFSMDDSSTDNVLTISDLYSLNLKTDLAVLAACQTGDGEYKKGQGITSLANAFAYAGVNSTVMSLWKVPDKSTKEIMVEFYRGLKNGLYKDQALRQAKLTYLKNAVEPKEKHPYFWAGFVVQGNMEPVHFKSGFPLKYLLFGVGLLIGLGLLYGKWRKNRA